MPSTPERDQEVSDNNSDSNTDQTTHEGTGDTTFTLRAEFLGERDASANAAEAGLWAVGHLHQLLGVRLFC